MQTNHLQLANAWIGLYAPDVATFGSNLRRLRKERGWPLEKLAELMGHKRASTVQAWEKDRRKPRRAAIEKLADRLGVTPAKLLEDVPSVYDELRGLAASEPDSARAEFTPIERRALKFLRRMNVDGQKLAVSRLAGLAAAFPRDESPRSSEQTRDTPAAITRKVRGTR